MVLKKIPSNFRPYKELLDQIEEKRDEKKKRKKSGFVHTTNLFKGVIASNLDTPFYGALLLKLEYNDRNECLFAIEGYIDGVRRKLRLLETTANQAKDQLINTYFKSFAIVLILTPFFYTGLIQYGISSGVFVFEGG